MPPDSDMAEPAAQRAPAPDPAAEVEHGRPAAAPQVERPVPVTEVSRAADSGRVIPLSGSRRIGTAGQSRSVPPTLAAVIDALDAGSPVPRPAAGPPDGHNVRPGRLAPAEPRPVQVTIGQIVVRAEAPAAPQVPAAPTVPQAGEPGLSLRDYLRGHREPR
jgi:hypothetical protein